MKRGTLRTDICALCSRARFKKYGTDRKTVLPSGAQLPEPVDTAPKLPAVRTKRHSVATALDAGVDYVNRHAETILTRLVHYVNTPESPHHEWALRLLAERVIPAKAFTSLAEREAGVGQNDKPVQPPVTIIVQGTGETRISARVVSPDAVPELEDLL